MVAVQAVAGMAPRMAADMAPLCALQAGLLHYLHDQLDSIGTAVEERYKLKMSQQLTAFKAQMASMQTSMQVRLGCSAIARGDRYHGLAERK